MNKNILILGAMVALSFGNKAFAADQPTTQPTNKQIVDTLTSLNLVASQVSAATSASNASTSAVVAATAELNTATSGVNHATTLAEARMNKAATANGTAEGPFISAGLSTADVPTAAGQSSAKQGFSYGLGWIFEIKKNSGFQVMIMAGQDVFGTSAGYPYEGDVWYSVSLGLNLESSKK